MFEIIEFMLVFEASDYLQRFVYAYTELSILDEFYVNTELAILNELLFYTRLSILISNTECMHIEGITDRIGEDPCYNTDVRRICNRSAEQDADTSGFRI